MLIYFIFLFICFISQFISQFKNSVFKIFIVVLMGLFMCFGYMTGSDWRVYEEFYNSIELYSLNTIPFEYGYYFYMLIFKSLKFDFWTFFISTKSIIFIIWSCFIFKHQIKYFYISFCLFNYFFGLSLFIDNPMRTLLAATIFLYSFRHIENRNFINFFFVLLLASTFHVTTLIMIPVYWLAKIKFKTKSLILTFIFFNIFMWVFDSQLRNLLSFNSGIEHLDTRINFYFADGATGEVYAANRVLSLGLIIRFFLFALIMYSKEKIEMRLGNLVFNLAVLSLFFYRLGIGIPIFERMEFYFCLPFCIVISDLIYSFSDKSKPYFILFLFLLVSVSNFKTITSEYKYIPYSNYLIYLFDDQKPTFEERSNYNLKNSPYGKKQ